MNVAFRHVLIFYFLQGVCLKTYQWIIDVCCIVAYTMSSGHERRQVNMNDARRACMTPDKHDGRTAGMNDAMRHERRQVGMKDPGRRQEGMNDAKRV